MRAFADAKELRSFLPSDDLFHEYKAVLGEGDANPDLVLFKYQPHVWDVKEGKPLLGKDGIPIRRHLVQQGVKFYATTAFPFYRGADKAKATDVRQAAPVVAEELRRVSARNYLLLGADATRYCPGFEYPFKRFDEVLGRTFHIGPNAYRVAHAPAAISSNPQIYGEFIRAVDDLLSPGKTVYPPRPEREVYQVLTNRMQANAALSRLRNPVACDIETSGLNPWGDRILTVQLGWEEGVAYAFPWDLFTPEEWGGVLGGRNLIFHNSAFDVPFLAAHGVFVQAHEDTLLMHSLLDESAGSHAMELLAPRYLGVEKLSKTVDYDRMENVDLKTLGRYGARDTDITLRMANHFRPMVEDRHIHRVLHRAQNAVARSSMRGIRVDRDKAQQFSVEIDRALHDRQVYLADTYGLLNANSPTQVAKLLYEDLGFPSQKLKGKTTTSSPAIEQFADDHPAVRDILEYRHLTKAGGTYVANILAASERDGRYHPEFRLAGTETGRVTEKLIVLIPRPDELKNPDLGKQYQVRLRELFLPDEGYVMVGADYRGLEVGIGAYNSHDPQLTEDYNTNLDTHSVVAIDAFDLQILEEPRATLKKRVQAQHAFQREVAKKGTFSWLYGGSEKAIQDQLKVPFETANRILTTLRSRYQGVARWQEGIRATILEHGSVTTPWGRTRHFLIHPGMSTRMVEDQLREGINFPNQAMASDANLAAFAECESRGIQTLFPLHDAIYAQAPEDRVERVARDIKAVMEAVLPGAVHFEAELKTGPNWARLG
jgi:DNA polymerase I